MTNRGSALLVALGLMACMSPACSHMRNDNTGTSVASENPKEDPRPAVVQTAPRSPYANMPTPAASAAIPPAQNSIERVHFGVNSPGPQLAPPVATPGEVTGPSPQIQAVAATDSPPPQIEIKAKPVDDPPLIVALRCYLSKRPAEAVIWLERYEKLNQDLLICLLPLVARLAEGGLQKSNAREIGNIVCQLESMTDLLRPLARLVIDKMCFVYDIGNFGVYSKLETDHALRPGEFVQVYVELKNFSSERDRKGKTHRISLASTMEIRDFDGRQVFRRDFPDGGENRPDISQTPRHDFFINYPLQVPSTFPPGSYTLRLIVTDVPTKRTAEQTLDFRVVPASGFLKGEKGTCIFF